MKKLFIACWLAAVLMGTFGDFWYERTFLPPADEREQQSVLIEVVGEFKTILARYLYFKMDIYHEVLEEQGLDNEKDAELMPLLRMITLLDPSMTDTYDQIVWDLYSVQHDVETARRILDEGIQRNPKDYHLRFRKALIFYQEKEYKECEKAAIEAIAFAPGPVTSADCLRLIYWSADHLEERDIQRKALHDLLKLRPNDVLWLREKERLDKL
ncbi:MAG: hypothetical protein KC800_18550 [Candidatus Eremiobacteraeota bacterium]|nr:hypothetical protein [Candidatus Eremiobacteraeota bacterium]